MSAQSALRWIVDLLDAPYAICGGLAAIGYGARRPLNDIDLFVEAGRFDEIAAMTAPHWSKPPVRACEEGWDLRYLQCLRDGVKIEIGDPADARIFDAPAGRWVSLDVDIARVERRAVLGVEAALMVRADLIAYKRILSRPVDLTDIAAIA